MFEVGTAILLACLAVSGCQSTPLTSASVPVDQLATHSDLVRAARIDLERCMVAFVENDWKQVATLGNRMDEFAGHWKHIPRPENASESFDQQLKAYGKAVSTLIKATQDEDIERTRQALQDVSRRVRELESVR